MDISLHLHLPTLSRDRSRFTDSLPGEMLTLSPLQLSKCRDAMS